MRRITQSERRSNLALTSVRAQRESRRSEDFHLMNVWGLEQNPALGVKGQHLLKPFAAAINNVIYQYAVSVGEISPRSERNLCDAIRCANTAVLNYFYLNGDRYLWIFANKSTGKDLRNASAKKSSSIR